MNRLHTLLAMVFALFSLLMLVTEHRSSVSALQRLGESDSKISELGLRFRMR